MLSLATALDKAQFFLYLLSCIASERSRRCVAADCNTDSGQGYSLHEFPTDDAQTCTFQIAVIMCNYAHYMLVSKCLN